MARRSGVRGISAGRTWMFAAVASMAVLAAAPARAALLHDKPALVTQPDGTTLALRVSGDEYYQWLHDARGYTVIQDAGGWYVYADRVGGSLVPTVLAPGRQDPGALGIPRRLLAPPPDDGRRGWMRDVPKPPRGPGHAAPASAAAGEASGGTVAATPPAPAPRTGTLNNLVVFIRFADQAEFGEPLGAYDTPFNGAGVSLRSYFREASYQALTISTTFYPASTNGYVLSYQDPQPRNYYQPYSATNPVGYTGGADGAERVSREQTLLANAVAAVAAQVPADLVIDADGDGYVDNVVFIVQGAYGDWAELLWPHRWALFAATVSIQGKVVWDFNLQLSSWIEVGVLCHEMFHTLGSPDLYHYSYDGLSPVGPWDLMEGTTSTPQHMGAYMKQRYGGWIASLPEVGTGTYTLSDVTQPFGNAVRVASPNSPSEYFVLEYRRQVGSYDSQLPGSGLLAYRINPAALGNASGPPDEVYLLRPGGGPYANGLVASANLGAHVGRPEVGAGTDPYPFLSGGGAGGIRVFDIGPAGTTITFRVCARAVTCDNVHCGDDGCGGTCGCADDGNPCTVESCASGLCRHEPVADGSPCEDGSLCTQADTCQAGACVGGVSVTCQPLDGCHLAGTCNPATGRCSDPTKAEGTPCDDGQACTRGDACRAGVCAGTAAVCPAEDGCRYAGVCNPVTGACEQSKKPDGTACSDGVPCTTGDVCLDGTCVAQPVVCPPATQCREASVCNPQSGSCQTVARPDGSLCDDGDACTRLDACRSGECVGGYPQVCLGEATACREAPVCDPATGECRQVPRADGTACDDLDPCTVGDACVAGGCVPGPSLECVAVDACHGPGTCDPATGACSTPVLADGTSCDDGDACTRVDGCLAGVCTGADPVACQARDACHRPGTCDPRTGTCSEPAMPDGTACDDGNACTLADWCVSGECRGEAAVACPAPDACHVPGTCDPATGLCTAPEAPDGTACDDHNACTRADACAAGACVGADRIRCEARDACHLAGACNPATGACSEPVAADGTTCDDGDACTRKDACVAGACVGAEPVACIARDGCHVAGTCDPATGACSEPVAADGTGCDDGDACTRRDACVAGACIGAEPVACTARDACHVAGTCDPATGACGDPAAPDGTPCDDDSACTRRDGCVAGACVGGDPVACLPKDGCHGPGTCDPATGACDDPVLLDGTFCDDHDACTRWDGCYAGTCLGDEPVVCAPLDACHLAGTCDPGTGRCSAPAAPDGTTCDDGDPCTLDDACGAGVCAGGRVVACLPLDACHGPGRCDPATGACVPSEPLAGEPCDDGDPCTVEDRCEADGSCLGRRDARCDDAGDAGDDPDVVDAPDAAADDGGLAAEVEVADPAGDPGEGPDEARDTGDSDSAAADASPGADAASLDPGLVPGDGVATDPGPAPDAATPDGADGATADPEALAMTDPASAVDDAVADPGTGGSGGGCAAGGLVSGGVASGASGLAWALLAFLVLIGVRRRLTAP